MNYTPAQVRRLINSCASLDENGYICEKAELLKMVMGDDMNYINPAAGRRNYEKHPERVFRLKQDVLVPAGTVFTRAPLERGGYDRIEGIVALGNDATAYLNLPLRVAEIDAAEWFEVGAERQQGAAGAAGAAGAELTPSGTHVPPALAPEKK